MSSLAPCMLSDLIGLPYELGGRGPTAYDCAGLVMEMQRRQGLPGGIPDTGDSKMSDHLTMRRVLQAAWREIEQPEPGCIVFFASDAHVGTMIDDGVRFLHTSSLRGSALIELLDGPLWLRKRRLFYVQRRDA